MTDTTVTAVRDILDMPPLPVRRSTFIPVTEQTEEIKRLRATILAAVGIWDAAEAEITEKTTRGYRRGYIYQEIHAKAARRMADRLRQDGVS